MGLTKTFEEYERCRKALIRKHIGGGNSFLIADALLRDRLGMAWTEEHETALLQDVLDEAETYNLGAKIQ